MAFPESVCRVTAARHALLKKSKRQKMMGSSDTLLILRQGSEGIFKQWLDAIGLEALIRIYPIPKLVSWGWLVPQHRVIFPEKFFLEWTDYPYDLDIDAHPDTALALLWDGAWSIDKESEPLWFLHPHFRHDDNLYRLLNHNKEVSDFSPPARITHPSGQDISPYAEWFFHWQGYALVDVFRFADCIEPLLVTPEIDDKLAGQARITARIIQDGHDPKDVLTLANRWGGLAEVMTWLSHYRTLDHVLHVARIKNAWDADLHKRGAHALAAHLGITANRLENAVKDKLLVQAQDWARLQGKHEQLLRKPLAYFTQDVALAVDWLCILKDLPIDHYLEKWKYTHRGQATWIELQRLLKYEYFTDREFFLSDAIAYLDHHQKVLPANAQFVGNTLTTAVDKLRTMNRAFGSLLRAFHKLHDEMTWYGDEFDLGFRNRSPLDYYLVLTLRAEHVLRMALENSGNLNQINPKDHKLEGYIEALAKNISLSNQAIAAFKKEISNTTRLFDNPPSPIARIMTLTLQLPVTEATLVKAFLCCVLARNYFAHHYYWDGPLLTSRDSAYLLGGVLLTVLTLCT